MLKRKVWRSKKYLDWVKTQPSCISGLPGGDAHHIKGHGYGGSLKAPDWMTLPLTREEHTEFHNRGWQTWEYYHEDQRVHIALTLGKAIEEGIITVKK